MIQTISAPIVTITSPEAGAHIEEYEVTVCGMATDPDQGDSIVSVEVIGIEADFESTGNPDDPAEVEFCQEIPLEPGINTISVRVTDSRGKTTVFNRTVHAPENRPPVADA